MSLRERRLLEALSAVPRHRAYIGMGGNVGEVLHNLRSALHGMAALPGTSVEAVSSLYRTRPVAAKGPDYLNAVAQIASGLGPQELMRALLGLESQHDRKRPFQNAPRTLDLDLLWFGALELRTPTLTLPHPRMGERAFVLVPLRELLLGDERHAPTELVRTSFPSVPDATLCHRLAREQGIEKQSAPEWAA